jgi:hypothetical protein
MTYSEAKEAYERAPRGWRLYYYKALQDALHEQLRQEVAKRAGKKLAAHYAVTE